MLSSDVGTVSPPSVKIGSSIVTVVLLTVVCVPLTCRLPVTIRSLPIVTSFGNPIVTPAVSDPLPVTSISFVVPVIVAT